MQWEFIVPGPLLGYRASIRRAFDPKYKAFKERVAWIATGSGVPLHKLDPKASRIELGVYVYWRRTPRIDWKNVYGSIEDALFKQDRLVHPGPSNGFAYCESGKPYNNEAAKVTIRVVEK